MGWLLIACVIYLVWAFLLGSFVGKCIAVGMGSKK